MFSCNVHVCERPLSGPPSHRGIHIMRGEASWTQVFRIKLIIPKGSPPPAPPCLHPSLFHHLHLHIPIDFIFSNLAVFSAPPSPQCCSSTSSYFPLPHPHYPFPSLPPLHLHPVTSTVTSPCFSTFCVSSFFTALFSFFIRFCDLVILSIISSIDLLHPLLFPCALSPSTHTFVERAGE